MKDILFWLKVSRPGLWFATIWLYMLPTSQLDIWNSIAFWLGLFYICFPLNFLIYGWNDIVDREIDALNPRKDSFWFGAKGTKEQLETLWKPIALVQIIIYPIIIWYGGWELLGLLLVLLFVNVIYNAPKNGLRSKPPFELLCQIGYLLVVPFSILINDTTQLPWQTYFYLVLFAFQSHLIGEVMDIEPDKAGGRKTIATVIGVKWTKLIIIGIVALEVTALFYWFKEYIFGGMLAVGLLWLIIDLAIIFKTQKYSLFQMKLFAIASNVIAIISMSYVWYSGCLLKIY